MSKGTIQKIGSRVLVQSDNLTVLGHHYMASTYSEDPKVKLEKQPAVHLDFVIMINGKTKSFGWSFMAEETEDEGWKCAADAAGWTMLYYLMKSIGYPLEEKCMEGDPFGYSLIDSWINHVMKKDSEPV